MTCSIEHRIWYRIIVHCVYRIPNESQVVEGDMEKFQVSTVSGALANNEPGVVITIPTV